MPDRTVYRQTPKGEQALNQGASALPAALGKLLSLIDGKLTVDELKAKLGRVEDAKLQGAIEWLKKQGHIEPMPAASDPREPAPDEPITLDFTIVARAPAPSPPPKPAAKPAPSAPPKPASKPAPDESKLDLTQAVDTLAPQPSPAKLAEAEQLTLAGMRTLKDAGYYVNILSKPGINHPPRSGTKYSVLLLDHDKQGALLNARTLMLADFEVRNAENRESALAEMKKVPLPDAIVLNLQIPDLNALNLLARLQQHEYYASVPVIVITSEHVHETVVDALARGAAGYMTKPFKESALLDTVRAVLGLR